MVCHRFVPFRFLLTLSLMALACPLRAEVPEVSTSLIDVPTPPRKAAKPAKIARVRIPLRLTPYQGVLVHTRAGNSRIDYRPASVMTHTLRARIERVNHFYIKNWHIETVPVAFDKDSLRYTVKLRFFKRYGDGMDLEEQVGSTELAGVLTHEGDRLFIMTGEARAQFNDHQSHPVLTVELGTSASRQVLSQGTSEKETVLAKPEGLPRRPAR